ncbi:putative ras-binding domain of Byr2 [Lyophyllum shimeji]|uniref:Ras-binding domain of Byr2 n=1 Tax=Lyophyllum shimeji TaxID=47721 RepID=A0A9P3PGA8_LYOSH|nr:putative ras-binding domain of Byr2 [Lyophyllum shimeji]
MAAAAVNGGLYSHDNSSQSPSKPSSPASPTAQFTTQQTSRSFINLNPGIRGQNAPFPATPTSSQSSALLESPPGVHFTDFLRTWTDNHVARWLTDIKCGNHAATFKVNDIRGDILLELDQQTLKEMGIASIGDRLRIVNAVKALRQRAAVRVVSTPVAERTRLEFPGEVAGPSPHDKSTSEKGIKDHMDNASNSRLAARSARPAPLQLNHNISRGDLPRIEPDSANRPNPNHSVRPLPHPNPAQPISQSQLVAPPGSAHSVGPAATRAGLPPLPPPPAGKPPPPPPGRPTTRPPNAPALSGWRTPTQPDAAPAYTAQPLPPAPLNRDLLTPAPANGRTGYHLPADPRSGNAGGAKAPPQRSTSPLLHGRARPGAAGNSNLSHVRNTSLALNSPVGSTHSNKLPPRPSTGNGHPYANAQLAPAGQTPLQNNLSPIAESFVTQHSSTSGTPSPPSMAYSVGRGAFNLSTPSHGTVPLETLRRKLVKFILPDEGQSVTIDVATCAGGVEVLEKALKKFGKGGSRSTDTDSGEYIQNEEGGLSIDGWAVYLGMGQEDGPGTPLTEAELLAICHAPPDHPTREHGLIVRKLAKARRYEERGATSSPAPGLLSPGQSSKNTKRASSISILSGLGVRDPEKALDPPSPTSGTLSPAVHNAKRPSKLRNFFGQRPPSELITNHLTEFFPTIEKKVLQRTARNSMMLRNGTASSDRRDSTISFAPAPRSRFSSSTQGSRGSQPRTSISPSRLSLSSVMPPTAAKHSSKSDSEESPGEEIPRMSLSTEDGRSIDLHPQDADVPSPTTSGPPQLLPPIPFPSESFSESFEGITGRRSASRTLSNASRRMSYMTELRSKRDRSDTASLMTVDEITASVESRRASMQVDGSDADDWTRVDSDDSEGDTLEESLPKEVAPVEVCEGDDEVVADDDEDEDGNDDDDDGPEAMTSRGGNKWIKGALIGAGSFGKVYLGMDASTGLLMAVKQVELPTGSAPNQERKKSMLSALEREIELLKNLQHPNIVQYLYSSLDDEYLNIFLEYVPGGSVTALLRNYGAFEEPLVKNFVRQILEGLNYLHERDIIHRDIKGANILVDNKGGIKISDFGISKKVDDNLLTGNRANRPSLQGSVFWMAPEVVKQSAHTRKADIWSVGCLVVEMLTGEHPWAQLTQMQAIFKIGSSAKPTIPSDITAEAQDFLRLTFELDHEARPSAAELLQHPWIGKKTKGGSTKPSAPTEASG